MDNKISTDLSRFVVQLRSEDGGTILLSLATNGATVFSTDGGKVWHYLTTTLDKVITDSWLDYR